MQNIKRLINVATHEMQQIVNKNKNQIDSSNKQLKMSFCKRQRVIICTNTENNIKKTSKK